ncbi:hypothetical protein ACFPES_17480 [Paenibacillus sp. GCM10023248]|uniref:hypothetical protein n=1 Tax=unclassified Paenibacillus TaxID=185978 RepID=UPI002379042C|nr:hypothetical protein [Paenibacillus sp. MAHUQ-63]MDD9268834.1 hypothetical protein [Paenibacillus sp. MAHUQ-63]
MMKQGKIVFAMLAAALGLAGSVLQAASADVIYGSYAPDGLRLPAAIELLADTPYYGQSDVRREDVEPEGSFAPQTVKVLETESGWSIGEAIWKIETMYGPKWIKPKPWEIDIAPPPRIVLLEETPLYRSQSTKGGAVTALAPQEVEVAGAEERWFYTNDPDSKAWIKIHTTWLGDLWAHIPVSRIGTVENVQRKAYYGALPLNNELATAMGVEGKQTDWSQPARGQFQIVREFTTIYDRAFEVQTDKGTTWTRDRGLPILSADDTLKITRRTPLFKTAWGGLQEEEAVLENETVTAFEKITEPLWGGRGPYELWHYSTWYHVRTSKGTGWINKLIGDPEGAVPVRWKLAITDAKELQRFPEVQFNDTSLLLRNQTVQVTEAWNPPNGGSMWLKVQVDNRTGWIPFWSGSQDQIWDQSSQTVVQLAKWNTNGFGIAPVGQDGLQLYSGERIGYTEKGESYLNANLLAEKFQYKLSSAAGSDGLSLAKNDYAIDLQKGAATAVVHWKGDKGDSVPLSEPVRRIGQNLYLNLKDVKSLLGLTQVFAGNEYTLFEKVYSVKLDQLPSRAASGRLELQAFVEDWTSREDYEDGQLPLQMTIEVNGDRGGAQHTAENQGVVNQPKSESSVTLYSLKASRPFAAGTHPVSVVIRIGERIVWKNSINLIVE